jgi:putative transposase
VVRTRRALQPLAYDVRLPDDAQADALRLLDATRAVVNQALERLWPSLDTFGDHAAGPAWKQVGKYLSSPQPHGDRQWRCESEVVGRVLRAQAERKKAFALVAPLLSDGFIRPKADGHPGRPAGKNRVAIKAAVTSLQQSLDEDEPSENDTSFVGLQNVTEQACNYYFQHDRFPSSYEEMQPVPLLSVGLLTYAGDDGREQGQAYRLALDLAAGVARFRFRRPDANGVWRWRPDETLILLPACLQARLAEGELLAPTLREECRANGRRFAVLDFTVAVANSEMPEWQSVERVLGADWGVHSLLTATAADSMGSKLVPAARSMSSSGRQPAMSRNTTRCRRRIPNGLGTRSASRITEARSSAVGASMSDATGS